MTKEDARNKQSPQAFWWSFGDQEIPKDLLKPRSKLLSRISTLTRANKAEDPSDDNGAHVSRRAEDDDKTMSPELSFYFRLADRILDS